MFIHVARASDCEEDDDDDDGGGGYDRRGRGLCKHIVGPQSMSASAPGEFRHRGTTTVMRLHRAHDQRAIAAIVKHGGPLRDLEFFARLYCETKDDGTAVPVFAPGEIKRLNVVGLPIYIEHCYPTDSTIPRGRSLDPTRYGTPTHGSTPVGRVTAAYPNIIDGELFVRAAIDPKGMTEAEVARVREMVTTELKDISIAYAFDAHPENLRKGGGTYTGPIVRRVDGLFARPFEASLTTRGDIPGCNVMIAKASRACAMRNVGRGNRVTMSTRGGRGNAIARFATRSIAKHMQTDTAPPPASAPSSATLVPAAAVPTAGSLDGAARAPPPADASVASTAQHDSLRSSTASAASPHSAPPAATPAAASASGGASSAAPAAAASTATPAAQASQPPPQPHHPPPQPQQQQQRPESQPPGDDMAALLKQMQAKIDALTADKERRTREKTIKDEVRQYSQKTSVDAKIVQRLLLGPNAEDARALLNKLTEGEGAAAGGADDVVDTLMDTDAVGEDADDAMSAAALPDPRRTSTSSSTSASARQTADATRNGAAAGRPAQAAADRRLPRQQQATQQQQQQRQQQQQQRALTEENAAAMRRVAGFNGSASASGKRSRSDQPLEGPSHPRVDADVGGSVGQLAERMRRVGVDPRLEASIYNRPEVLRQLAGVGKV
jgi:hypothetical protein